MLTVLTVLQSELRDQYTALRNLQTAEVVYIAAVYHLETIRVRSGSTKALYAYLGSAPLVTSALAPIVASIHKQAFRLFLHELHRRGRTTARAALLEDECLFLTAACCHRYKQIRARAHTDLAQLQQQFPQLLWNRRAIFTLLDAVDAVVQRADMVSFATATSASFPHLCLP